MTKHKIITEKEAVSSEEIAKRRNFESILKAVKKVPFYQKPLFLASIAAGVVLVATISLFFILKKDKIIPVKENIIAATVEKDKGKITPPMPEVNFAYQVFEVGNEAETNWKSERGSTVHIPKNALVDKNGNFVKGKVKIKFREMHDPVDFFLSGIPMTYDSGGTKYVFESAGMVELLAFQDNEPVFLHPGKSATISLVSGQQGDKYNLYQYDTALGNWVIKGKDKVDLVNTRNKKSVLIGNILITEEEMDLKDDRKTIEKEINKIEQTKPEAPRKVNVKKKQYIELGLDVKEFPELAVYKDVKFEVGNDNKNYNPKDVSSVVWEGADLTKGEANGSYNLTLKKGKREMSYIVYPALDGEDYEQAQKTYDQKFFDYKVAYEKQKTELKRLEERIKEEEKRCKKEIENAVAAVNNIGMKVQRTFRISGFGIYNCDAPWLNDMPGSVQAQFTTTEGKNLKLRELYLVKKSRNAIISIKPENKVKINYNPTAQIIIWGITSDNKLAIVDSKTLEALSSAPQEISLKMQVINEPLQTAEDVRKYIRI